MHHTLDQAQVCIDNGDEGLWLVNLGFHQAVAATTGNAVIEQVIDSILTVHQVEQREILRIHGDAQQDLNEHRAIAAAVADGDAPAARASVEAHLRGVLQVVERWARQQP